MSIDLSPNKEKGIGLLWGLDCIEEFLKKLKLKLIIISHEGPDAREKRHCLAGMYEGYTIDHDVESGKLITLFSAPDYPQFHFEAIAPRPKVNAYYDYEDVIDSDEDLDLASMVITLLHSS
ncbi:hypothetical protein REPUB_Repub06bG0179100 [Reevesia pubescens]